MKKLALFLCALAFYAQAQFVVTVPTQAGCIAAASAAGGVCLTPYVAPVVTPPIVPPAGDGMTAAMWAEIATQRVAFGDPNDCKARVDAVPTTGYTLAAGGNIATALASNATVLLQTGTYRPTGARLDIITGKKLVAAPGAKPVLDLSAMTNFAVIYVGDSTTLAGIEIKGAQGISIVTYDVSKGRYSNGGLLYNLTVHDSGLTGSMDDGTNIAISGGGSTSQGQNWCTVAVETYNAWNPCCSAPTSNGGNSDGISSKFGAGQNSFIAVNSHNNGDDGIDMWQGGATYHYFGNYHDGGKVPGVTNGGDGNGVKLGIGSVAHKFYKTTANNNRNGGFNLNGNTMQPVLVQSSASGNAGGDYSNGMVAPSNPPVTMKSITLVGDSTVDSASGWGNGFIAEMKSKSPATMVSNQAVSGESTQSFRDCLWQAAVSSSPSFVLIQLGHNDSWSVSTDCLRQAKQTTIAQYQANLRFFIADARQRGSVPVLVTPLDHADGASNPNILNDYVAAMRVVAQDAGAPPLVDLNALSRAYNLSIGASAASALYTDSIHLNASGAAVFGPMVADEFLRQIAAVN